MSWKAKREAKKAAEFERQQAEMKRLNQLHKKARNRVPKAAARPCPTCHGARKLRVMKGDGKIGYRRCGACRGSGSI